MAMKARRVCAGIDFNLDTEKLKLPEIGNIFPAYYDFFTAHCAITFQKTFC